MKVPKMLALVLAAVMSVAQAPVASFTATTGNLRGAPEAIRIDILRWSTDAERDQVLAAWTQPGSAPGGGRGAGTRAPAVDPTGAGNDATVRAALAAGPGPGGAKGRAAVPPPTPERSLATALEKAAPVGRLWSSEVAGYSIRYAVKIAMDGGERIILITDRRLGAWNDRWEPLTGRADQNHEFSVIELRLNAQGQGEGKTSLTGKIAAEGAAKTLALEDYAGSPALLKNVRRRIN
jgi:hypothetical protein